jgi:2,4-dienoyl-CoA reductase-like NADH-dependent reductase (Old Yellow Enzyme family)
VAEVVAFAEALLANPDLPSRIARQGPYNQPDPIRFYTDYPFLNTNPQVGAGAVERCSMPLGAVDCR